ncbi:DUF4189 domain-containing protein [Rhizobium sp.]
MTFSSKIAVFAIVAAATLATSVPEAYAWSCQATADDGTYGYSYNYPNRKQARRRAMAECQARTNYDCYIAACQPNG